MTNYEDVSTAELEQTVDRLESRARQSNSRGKTAAYRAAKAELESRDGSGSDDDEQATETAETTDMLERADDDEETAELSEQSTERLRETREAYDRHGWNTSRIDDELRRRGETAELSASDEEVAELTAAGSVSVGELSDTVLTENVATDDDGRLVEPTWEEIGRLSRSTVENLAKWYGEKMEELSEEYQGSDVGSDRQSVVAEEHRKAKQYKNRLENRYV